MGEIGPVVFASVPFSDDDWLTLTKVAPGAVVRQQVTTAGDLSDLDLTDVEIACIHPYQDFEPPASLRWVLTASAGVDAMAGGKLWRSGVTVVNASGIHAHSIAELVFAMVLSLRHRLPFFARRQGQHAWSQQEPEARSAGELVGLTMGVLGYGSIGREVGRLAKAFGMRLIATTIDPTCRADTGFCLPTAGDREGVLPDVLCGPEAQDQVIAEADVLVLAVPSAKETRHLIGEREVRMMKPSALLINVARGAVVDEAVLARALAEHWIEGAGLDVFEVEPLPGDSPLWAMDNAILTPHVAGDSPNYWKRLMQLLAENVRRERAGEPLLNVVERTRGF